MFSWLKRPDIHAGVKAYEEAGNAALLDVRTPQEFETGHIPGSINLPLQVMGLAERLVPNKQTTVYVYCQSGGRSRQAAQMLRQMGYNNVENLGGISAWKGRVER